MHQEDRTQPVFVNEHGNHFNDILSNLPSTWTLVSVIFSSRLYARLLAYIIHMIACGMGRGRGIR